MELLKLEYQNSPEGSYNYILGELVKKIRHYTSNVPMDEFKTALPDLKKIETQLQKLDESIGEDKRFYIEEIMTELSEESEMEEKLFEDFEWASKSILASLFEKDFLLEDYSYELKKNNGVHWIEFYGNKSINDNIVLVVKEVFKSVCYKFGIVFIDGYLRDYKNLHLN